MTKKLLTKGRRVRWLRLLTLAYGARHPCFKPIAFRVEAKLYRRASRKGHT